MKTYSREPTTTDAPGQKNEPSCCGGRTRLRVPGPERYTTVKQPPDCTHAELLPKPVIGPELPSRLSP